MSPCLCSMLLLPRIDRITFKAAFESGSLAKRTGGFKRPLDLPAITPFKAPTQPTPRKLGRPPQKTPSKAVGRGGPPGPPGPHTLGRGLIITPPLASSTPAPRPPTRIPHNLLNNANVSITREGGVGMEEDVIEIIEVSERRAGKLQISKRPGLNQSSSSSGSARRNMSVVYSSRQQRGGAVRSQLRPKMSQKHGVFKKSKIPRYPNKVKSSTSSFSPRFHHNHCTIYLNKYFHHLHLHRLHRLYYLNDHLWLYRHSSTSSSRACPSSPPSSR